MKSIIAVLLLTGIQYISAQNLWLNRQTITPVTITGDGTRSCPSQQQRESVHQMLSNTIVNMLESIQCGAGQWTRVAYLNMSDPSQTCPSAWRVITTNGVRVCGRPPTSNDTCHGTFYTTGHTYTKVCGRVIGYQIGHPDAFHSSHTINEAYVEGVSITHGSPRSHIWTLAAGTFEASGDCPCATGSTNVPLSFVGNNYYCESGNRNTTTINYYLYASDPLWDGQQCDLEGTCCSNGRSPPWFVVNLINSTTDSIEVRICSDYNTSEDTPIQLLELYIQ